MKPEVLVHHPLLAQMGEDSSYFMCRTNLTDADQYELAPSHSEPLKIDRLLSNVLVMDKLRQSNILVHKMHCGILDLNNKKVYPVDFIGELWDAPVVVMSYYSESRRGKPCKLMEGRAKEIISLCEKYYKVSPTVSVVNVYGEGRSEHRFYTAEMLQEK